ncbi:uncharacterized protein LOC131327763 [Rhododendron vialii]|uniref:uncharacterized protein LOC131327763 n=1 Tax=Rhododendron vialii TaxID=182163 RepID=UPI00266015D1|nr:uncharacterized protein LOC131327763 [Rhododendron vialii]
MMFRVGRAAPTLGEITQPNLRLTRLIFETRAVMVDWVRRVGKENGFVIVISKSASIKGNKMTKCIFICERGGLYRPPPEGHSMQRITGTKKCDCPFKLRGVPQPPDCVMWSLKVVKGFHNHEPAKSFEGHEYPSRLTPIQQQLVRDMSSSTAPREILNFLRQQDSSISTGIRSIYNVKAQYKKEQLGGLSPIGYVLNELKEKNYIYDYHTNEHTNEITDILWVHPRSLELSVNFFIRVDY